MTAEREAQKAKEKFEDAERAAELKSARLAKRERLIADKEKEIERLRQEAAAAMKAAKEAQREAESKTAPTAQLVVQPVTPPAAQPVAQPVLLPAVKPVVAKPIVPSNKPGPSVEVDEVLEFLDTLDDTPAGKKPTPSSDTSSYEMPLE